jgi:hypothetical protein
MLHQHTQPAVAVRQRRPRNRLTNGGGQHQQQQTNFGIAVRQKMTPLKQQQYVVSSTTDTFGDATFESLTGGVGQELMLNINGNGVDPLLNGLVSPTQQLIMPTQSTSPHMPGVHGGGQASAGGRDSCASKRSDASHQSHDQCSLSDGGGDGGNDENGSVGSDMEELNTKELAQRISAELKRYSIPQAIFAQRVLCRSQGTLSDLLRNPKPWSKLKSGRETFRRMFKWLQEPEFQRMSALRMAGE